MEPRLVLFDCDGTLVDSGAVIVAAMTAAFEHHSLVAPSPEEIRAIIGLSLPYAVAALCERHPEAPIGEIVDAYKEAYRYNAIRQTMEEPLFPGTAATLEALAADPATLLGVVTGKSRRGLNRVLARHGFTDHFIVTMTADDAASKPAPDMVLNALAATGIEARRTVVIGDTSFDMAMARAAGAGAIGVSWGYHDPARLLEGGAQTMVEAMTEVPGAIDAILSRA